MLKDEQIKLLLESLDREFDSKKKEYEGAKHAIQDLCEHNELEDIMVGKVCKICGKIFPYNDRSTSYIKKRYIEKDYWKKALQVCKEFAIESNLPGEDIVKALRKVRKEWEE